MHALVEHTLRDFRYALRTFRRAPLVAFTIVSTVAIGLGVVAVLFTILNTFLFRVDGVAACFLAAWIPATRAAHLNPMRTLRQD